MGLYLKANNGLHASRVGNKIFLRPFKKNHIASGHSRGLFTSCVSNPPVVTQRILIGPARVEWLRVNTFSPNKYHISHAWHTTCWHVENKSPKYVATIFPAQTRYHWRKSKGSANVQKSWLELKLKINKRSLSSIETGAPFAAQLPLLEYSAHDWRAATSVQRAPDILARVGPVIAFTSSTRRVAGDTRQVYLHYSDVIVSAMASQITGVSIVYLTVGSGADQRKHQSSASLAFVRGIHRWPVNSRTKASNAENVFISWRQHAYEIVIALDPLDMGV